MFTLGKDSKAKDADQFRKTSEAMALYIRTKYGKESAREFEHCAEFVHPIPAVDAAVTLIHGAKVLAHTTRITAKLSAMRLLKVQLDAATIGAPAFDIDLVEKGIELDDKILVVQQQLLEPPDVEGSMTGEQLALHKTEAGDVISFIEHRICTCHNHPRRNLCYHHQIITSTTIPPSPPLPHKNPKERRQLSVIPHYSTRSPHPRCHPSTTHNNALALPHS